LNIFILDKDIKKSSQYLGNKHIVKMILEHCQVLCSVHYSIGTQNIPYKKTHYNHPCSIWARESIENYNWLINYTQAMLEEYTFRYGKIHASQKVLDWLKENIPSLPNIARTRFALAMPDKYKSKSVVKSYRAYYLGEKSHLFEWKYRKKPYWI